MKTIVNALNNFCRQQRIAIPGAFVFDWKERKLTRYPGLYVLGISRPLYIGMSCKSIYSRLNKHRKKFLLGDENKGYAPVKWKKSLTQKMTEDSLPELLVFHMPEDTHTGTEILLMEAYMIHVFQPPLNTATIEE